MDRISLYWKNATAEAVGDKHGVTEKELKELAPRIKTLTKQFNRRPQSRETAIIAICRTTRT